MTEAIGAHVHRSDTESNIISSCGDPLVTLAIPTLNRPNSLREALTCAMAQNYTNLEILVSDNGSRDETRAVAQALMQNDPRIRFRRNETTVPIHEHFTQCIQEARGEFFILLCDDDQINCNFVSEVVGVAKRHPDVNVVLPANVTIDERGTVIREFARPENEVFDGFEIVCNWIFGRGALLIANVITVLARTDLLRQFGGYRVFGGARNDENLLFLQCAITGRVGFARGAVFSWRIHDSYGNRVTPEQIVDSSRDFLRYLQDDPVTLKALAGLTTKRRKQILKGVRYMTALEVFRHTEFQENPFRWKCLRIFLYRHDAVFCYVGFLHYQHKLRRLIRSVVSRIASGS